MLLASGVAGQRHHSAFHRFFSEANWSRDALGLAVFRLLLPFCDDIVLVAIDDTLARKRGLKMFGTGMHHDPLLSSRSHVVTNWGHCWVVLCVVIHFPLWPERPFSLPILFRLYLNKKRAAKERRAYRSKPELGASVAAHLVQTPGQSTIPRFGGLGLWRAKRAGPTADQLRFDQPVAPGCPLVRRCGRCPKGAGKAGRANAGGNPYAPANA